MIGIPTSKTLIKYVNTKAPPPFCPVRYGNFHMLPKPTADPKVAKKTAKPDEKDSLLFILSKLTLLK